MTTEPTPGMPHAPTEAAWSDDDRVCAFDGCGESCRHDEETPRPAAQEGRGDADTAGTETDRGTGEREAHGRSEAVVWGQGADCPHKPEPLSRIPADLLKSNPRTVIHLTAEDMARGPLTVEIDHAPLLHFEPSHPPATIPNEAMPHLAGFVNALKPLHFREVADSLDTLGHTEAARAVRSAARDLEDGE